MKAFDFEAKRIFLLLSKMASKKPDCMCTSVYWIDSAALLALSNRVTSFINKYIM
jgi:hypothetical protein